MTDQDPYHLQRFVDAQQAIYSKVLVELGAGRKQSHWMWFIFPQIKGLGRSSTAAFYAINSADEAKAYLQHPLLGTRLRECVQVLLSLENVSADDVFGYPDNLKFCSSMTLFESVAAQHSLFAQAIDEICGGHRDERTLAILAADQQ